MPRWLRSTEPKVRGSNPLGRASRLGIWCAFPGTSLPALRTQVRGSGARERFWPSFWRVLASSGGFRPPSPLVSTGRPAYERQTVRRSRWAHRRRSPRRGAPPAPPCSCCWPLSARSRRRRRQRCPAGRALHSSEGPRQRGVVGEMPTSWAFAAGFVNLRLAAGSSSATDFRRFSPSGAVAQYGRQSWRATGRGEAPVE